MRASSRYFCLVVFAAFLLIVSGNLPGHCAPLPESNRDILRQRFGSRDKPASEKEQMINLAFVLLAEPRMPAAQEIIAAFGTYAGPGEILQEKSAASGQSPARDALLFDLGPSAEAFVVLAPAAVPNREADDGVQFSMSAIGTDWTMPEHKAHLLVAVRSLVPAKPLVRMSRFNAFLAAVVEASAAVGVYWGHAGATHEPEFFKKISAEQELAPHLLLWSGVSVAREKDGRISLLSLGMQQLELPDLLLVVGKANQEEAFEVLYDCLTYLAERGEALPEGDTIGRSEEEKLPIHYVPSPVDPAKQVWRVEMP